MAIATRTDRPASRGAGEYGDVAYADPTNKAYPIDTADHVRAAWSYIHQARNGAKYSAEDLATIKGRIQKAAKRLGVTIRASEEWTFTMAMRPRQTRDIEVFSVGPWAGMKWTTADLDEMVQNFGTLLPKGIEPPLKLGHDDKQMLAQRDGQPALGWISALKRKGKKLVATISDLPPLVAELIDAKSYKRCSSEIYPAFELTGAEKGLKSGVTGKVLSAVALLGADIPEVKDLAGLHQVLAAQGIETTVTFAAPADTAIAAQADDLVQLAYGAGSLLAHQSKVRAAVNQHHGYSASMMDLFPGHVIVEKNDGSLVRHGITTATDGSVNLGAPQKVQVAYEACAEGGGDTIRHRNAEGLVLSHGEAERAACPVCASTDGSHPRYQQTHDDDPDKTGDDTEDRMALSADELKKMREEIAADLLKELKPQFQTQLTEALTAAETKHAAELKTLREEATTLANSQRAAEQRALQAEAKQFCESRTTRQNFKLFGEQAKLAEQLYVRMAGGDVVIKAAEAEVLKLAEAGKGRDLTMRDLFTMFVDAFPNQSRLASETAHAGRHTAGGGTGDAAIAAATDLNTVVEAIEKRTGLKFSDYKGKTEIMKIVAAEHPELVPSYGSGQKAA